MLIRSYLQTHYSIPRRKITELIDKGQIFLNNKIVMDYKAEIQHNDKISIPSLKILETFQEPKEDKQQKILLFNKPKGYTCSKSDPYNKTFYELLPSDFVKKFYYIGRLDKESRGLMLLTNDPKMVHEYEHPSKEVEKTYLVKLNRKFNRALKEKILSGLSHEGELLRTKKIEKSDLGLIKITLNEGKKRHIRRIFKLLGYEVIDLQRIAIGKYQLGPLPEGKYTSLNS